MTAKVEARAASGKEARGVAPRSGHGDWRPAADRPDPVELLIGQDATRVPELVPIRHGRMLASPFTFYRGAAAIMAADIGSEPSPGLDVQLCGDAHLSNFGVFRAPDRRLVFDVNDFDETLPGPFEWDLKRLVASFAVAGRDRGFDQRFRREIVLAAVRAYREAMHEFAAMRDLEVWYSRLDVEQELEVLRSSAERSQIKKVERNVAKAQGKNSLRAFDKLTRQVNGERRIVSDPPLIVPVEDLVGADSAVEADGRLQNLLDSYRKTLQFDRRVLLERYRYVHAAHKVVGVGSVGTRAWIVLLLGRDDGDPLFLQAKEAQRSVVEPFTRRSRFDNQGRRVVEGQRLMQAASDIFLGWLTGEGIDGEQRDFYVRQLWDGKSSADIDSMLPEGMTVYGRMCGWTLARAHARSGDRVAIAAYLGGGSVFDKAMADFAEAYADQSERDFDALEAAARDGRIDAASDI